MAIKGDVTSLVTGILTQSYPMTQMVYFQALETGTSNANIISVRQSPATLTNFGLQYKGSIDVPAASWLSNSIIADNAKIYFSEIRSMEGTGINPVEDFSIWWALMTTLEADGITMTHNVWSGVGQNAVLHTGITINEILEGAISNLDTVYVGADSSVGIKIQECVVVDRVLTTGQIDAWVCGVPAPQANLPGNIIFYQPLVSGYNEPTSIGYVTGFSESVPIVEAFVGPVMVDLSNNVNIVQGAIAVQTNFGQVDADDSGILSNSDSGVLSYSLIYGEGTGLGNVGNIYHNSVTIASNSVEVLDLQTGTFNPINLTFDREMARVKSVTIENKSGTGNLYLDFSTVNSSTVFRDMFGDPSGLITLPANSSYHINDGAGSGYIVDSGNKDFVISGGDFDGLGTLFITVMGDI